MADKEKTPQNGAQTAKAPADSHRTGITFHDRPMYIDDDDRVYYIDDDGNREYKIKLADVLSDEQRASFEAASKKALSAIADTERIREAINKATGKIFTPEIKEMLREIRDTYKPFFDLLDEIDQLRPYISAELKKPEYNGKSLDDLLDEYTPREMMDLPEDSLLLKAIEAAKDAAIKDGILPQIRYNVGTELQASTDKLSNVFFSIAAPKSKNYISGQREMLNIPREEMIPLKYEHDGAAKQITLFYDFFPNESQLKKLGLDSKFDSYDYLISTVLDNLLLEDNDTVSLTKVWHELGNAKSPNSSQLTELYKRIARGATTIVTIDDEQVQKAWGNDTDGTYNEIISPLMPVQIHGEKFIANGNVAKAQLRINGLSPFFVLSQNIGHYSTWKKEILQLYTGRKTTRYYSVFHFLMAQIGWMRNPNSKRSNKITYESLYNYTGDASTRSRQLTRDMMYRLLDEVFIPAGYIKSYKEDNSGKPGVKLNYTKNAAALLPADKK